MSATLEQSSAFCRGCRAKARGLLVLLAFVLPLIAGKLFTWQTGLFGLLVVLAALAALLGSFGSGGRPRLMAADWSLIALLIVMAVASLGAPYLHGALLAVLQLLGYALCFWLARSLLVEEKWRQALVIALVAGGALVAVIGLREYLLTWWTTGDLTWRIFSTFFNPNLTAGYLLVGLPLAAALTIGYWRAEAPESPLGRPLSLTALLLMLAALPLTGSKGGALGALAMALVFGWTLAPSRTPLGRRLRRWTLAVVGCGMLLSLLLPPLRARLVTAFTTQSNSAAFRYYTWRGMVDMIADQPLQGFGPGSFEWVYPRYAQAGFTRLGHQSYLQVATEGGLPALAAFLAFWVALVLALARRLREETDLEGRLLPAVALAAVAGFLVHNLVDYSWHCPAVAASLLLLGGVALAPPGSEPRQQTAQSRGALVAQVAVLLFLLSAAVVLAVKLLPAQYLHAQAQAARRSGNLLRAQTLERRAVRLDPLDADLHASLSDTQAHFGTASGLAAAIRERQEVARLRPTDSTNWRRLALLEAERGEHTKALEAVQQALAHNANYVLGWATQARVAEQAGDMALAAAAWQRLDELYDTPVQKYAALGDLMDPTYLYAWEFLGTQAEAAGDMERAQDYWRKMADLLVEFFALSPRDRLLLQVTSLLQPGEEKVLHRMAGEVAERLGSTGRSQDAAQAENLRQAQEAALAQEKKR